MPAVGVDYIRRKEADKALRKTFVTNLNLRPERIEKDGRNEQILCQRCASIFENSEEEGWQLDIGTLGELNDAAAKGCVLCILLKETCSALVKTYSGPLDKYFLAVDWDRSRMTIEQGFDGYRRRGLFKSVVDAELDIFVEKEDPAAYVIIGRPDIEDFTSSKTFEIIQHWLHECASSENHATCRRKLDQQVPLRLVDIGKEGDVNVKLSQRHGPVDYVALSYCWGGPQNVVLTAEDASQAICTFDFYALPATIQDAIVTTQKLGVRYLWVDALCIIQKGDDGMDFAMQGPKMDGVYGSAFLTIAAASTSKVSDGILSSRKTDERKDLAVKLPYELSGKGSGTIMISARNRVREYEAEPLLSRCWTLQERILSQRVLSFHKNHLTWNCRHRHQSSDNLSWPNTDLSYLLPSIIPQEFFAHTAKPTTKVPKFWRLCVEDYSKRFLTVETDKLTALAGVVRRIHKQTRDTYLAGLSKSDFMMQLCWSTVDSGKQRPHRPSCYLAPSWSWASIISGVKFLEPVNFNWAWKTRLLLAETSFMRELNPLSKVDDGWLLLRGPVIKARTVDEHGVITPVSFSNEKVPSQSYLSGIMDDRSVVDENQFSEFFWLWVFGDNSSVAFLLLLDETNKAAVFKRVGSKEVKLRDLVSEQFRDAVVQNITLI